MDTFDRVFCWTLTVGVVGAGCYFVLTTKEPTWESVFVGIACSACVVYIWTTIRKDSRKIIADRERDFFLAAASRYFRIAEDSETGFTGVDQYERARAMAAWERYRQQVLDQRSQYGERAHRRSPR